MLKTNTLRTLEGLVEDLKIRALVAGRYKAPFTTHAYDNRPKSEAFRCWNYNTTVRQINALEDCLNFVKEKP